MDKKEIKLIFIISLPRSGSTLLQRILGNHPKIHTISEPWFLLPLFNLIQRKGIYTEYSHRNAVIAIDDMINNLPNKYDDFYEEIREFVIGVYNKICFQQKKHAIYFIDKTPRYHYILDYIYKVFPDAKFIYLMRNPLSIVSSMLQTDENNIWNLYFYNIDLFDGVNKIILSYEKYSHLSIRINFENLILNPYQQMKEIYKYLDIDLPDDELCLKSNTLLKGSMGDPINELKEKQLNTDSLDKWKLILNNPIRKIWIRKYIRWIGYHRMKNFGYDLNMIETELDKIPTKIDLRMFMDIYRIIFGIIYSNFEYTIVRNNLKYFPQLLKSSAKT